jgi:hypothetical protein
MFERDDGVVDCRMASPGDAPQWPLYVRVFAVFHVLSYGVQWIGFLGLTGTAALLYGLRHRLDGVVLGLGLGGVICVILCSAFRRWFVRWGRKNYPARNAESE